MSVFFRTFSDVSGTSFGAVDAPRGLAESLSRLYTPTHKDTFAIYICFYIPFLIYILHLLLLNIFTHRLTKIHYNLHLIYIPLLIYILHLLLLNIFTHCLTKIHLQFTLDLHSTFDKYLIFAFHSTFVNICTNRLPKIYHFDHPDLY